MRIPASFSPRRPAALAAVVVLVATGTAAGVAFASGGGHDHKTHAHNAGTRAPDAIDRAARTALERLVSNGTIDQAQANAIERHVAAGFIDPAALIAAGTVSATQMQAIANSLDQVKRSFAGASGNHPHGQKVAAPGSGDHAPAVIVRAARTALQRLVANGSITQAQARAIVHDIASGSMDTHALVANGTLSQSQMRAVQHALADLKRAVASQH
jgi:hypothetical protein